MKSLGVIIWILCIVTSAVVAVPMGLAFLSINGAHGPGAPLEGVAALVALGLSAVCILAFIFCLKLRPPKDAFTVLNVSAGLAIWAGFVAVLWILPQAIGGYNLTVQVLDSAGKPMPDIPIRYEAYQKGRGLASGATPAKGTASTDGEGRLTIRTNHQHQIFGSIRKEGFRFTSFDIDPEYSAGNHQFSASRDPADPRSRARSQVAYADLPAADEVLVTIYLATNQEGDDVPLIPNPKKFADAP